MTIVASDAETKTFADGTAKRVVSDSRSRLISHLPKTQNTGQRTSTRPINTKSIGSKFSPAGRSIFKTSRDKLHRYVHSRILLETYGARYISHSSGVSDLERSLSERNADALISDI